MSLVGYEDKLREASALGDMDAIKLIAKSGKVNINHQHKVCSESIACSVSRVVSLFL